MDSAEIMRVRYRGAMVGGAVGDALGAPVEFMTREEILRVHGPEGVTGFVAWTNDMGHAMPAGAYTDDTQLTLATAAGMLRGLQGERARGLADFASAVWERYLEWCALQDEADQRRWPGATCLAALRSGEMGDTFEPLNDRKGAGGIMRIGPVGLALLPGQAFETGAEVAAITHGHPTGYLAAGTFAEIVSRVVRGEDLQSSIGEARETLISFEEHEETVDSLDLAVELFMCDSDLDEAYALLGEGWVAEEALGIALFSALSFPSDFAEGVLSAVNVTGDSDTTGSLTGTLLGALLGYDSIPGDWARGVEDARLLIEVADDLFAGFVQDEPLAPEKYPPA